MVRIGKKRKPGAGRKVGSVRVAPDDLLKALIPFKISSNIKSRYKKLGKDERDLVAEQTRKFLVRKISRLSSGKQEINFDLEKFEKQFEEYSQEEQHRQIDKAI